MLELTELYQGQRALPNIEGVPQAERKNHVRRPRELPDDFPCDNDRKDNQNPDKAAIRALRVKPHRHAVMLVTPTARIWDSARKVSGVSGFAAAFACATESAFIAKVFVHLGVFVPDAAVTTAFLSLLS